ncbi:hypothetical protein [Spirosoma radiotolerans]|uniref:Uncharacterized protein n=1 Tax=Spirosoma radiotolerans TaxID=1379870 RepID=A0A0E3V5R5_9BACT|nr:hypothetical protein [Spirosoma radiotolerans]AKD54387.1 hypothetical protein SD10_05140 [Spirosoma radiotolerans]
MPIKQSVQARIRAEDFHDKAFSFTVESVVEDLPASHRDLVVTVSDGYYMTTSLTSQPRREQAFEHIQQLNRQWVASGTVTLAYVGNYPKNGVLTIQNSAAETVVLPIEVTTALTRNPQLTISESELSFTQTAGDKPAYLLLTITQPLVDTPVTLTTDAPGYFQLASDSRPYFGSALTVVSPAPKFHVHIRYAASKPGLHKGQLTIQTPYDSQTVALQGRRTGWLSRKSGLTASLSQPTLESSNPARRTGNWVALAILVGISGLGYAGYTHKCQLFPSLCQDTTPKTTLVKNPLPYESTASGSLPDSGTKAVYHPERAQKNLTQVIDSLSRLQHSFPVDKPGTEQATVSSEEPTVSTRTNVRRREAGKKAAGQTVERTQPKPTSANEESELEKALNKPL